MPSQMEWASVDQMMLKNLMEVAGPLTLGGKYPLHP